MEAGTKTPVRVVPLAYADARSRIRNGDLLLWKPTSFAGDLIAEGTDALYSHVAMAGWFGDVLLQFEFLQWHGGRAVTLSGQVDRYPGRCDVYRVPNIHGRMAVESLARRTGTPYGWRDFARIAIGAATRRVLPWWPRRTDPLPDDRPMVCSGAVAAACWVGGCSPEGGKPAWEVSPGELAAPFSRYQFTLYSTVAEAIACQGLSFACAHLPDREAA